jgi:hypothetical protein
MYTLSYCVRTYSIHQNIQSPGGSLIDGGENGGLSGSDVVVLYENLLTADVTVTADNTLQQIPVCTIAGIFSNSVKTTSSTEKHVEKNTQQAKT